ncbi:hypothetical protein ACH0AH_07825 [Microbacterium paludicola]|uniref:hypothetical protein n=1 Tax=Microbacterium paludicola TaxID=300019 RepID=UPI0038796DEE
MTDGRIPGKWINEPRFIEMSVDAWCVFTKAIAWSNEAGTDGHIKRRYLNLLHPDGEHPQAYAEIAALGLWEPTSDGYQFNDWNKKAHHGGLGQELAENVRNQKERNRKKVADWRKRQGSTPVTGYVTAQETGHVGQEQEQDRLYTGSEIQNEENVNPETGEVGWWTAPIPAGLCEHGNQLGHECGWPGCDGVAKVRSVA